MGKKYQNAGAPDYKMPSNDFLKSEATSNDDMLTVEELINALKTLPANSKICITQDGNYAVGDLAYIYKSPIQIVSAQNIYAIGHSEQGV